MPRPAPIKVAPNPEISRLYDQQDKDFYTDRIKDQFEVAEGLIAAKVTEAQPCQKVPDIYTSERFKADKCLRMAQQVCQLCTTKDRCYEVGMADPNTSFAIYAGLSAKQRRRLKGARGVATGAKVV